MPERTDNAIVPAADPRNDVLVLGPSQYAPALPAEPEQPNLLKLVHHSLRGRYPYVIVLALAAAVAGGFAGFRAGKPMYKAEGTIRIQPHLPKILYETELTNVMPNFVGHVNAQANLVQNERVINRALDSEAWRSLGRTNFPGDVSRFRKNLTIRTSREMPELISVSFTDDESQGAKVGVDEILKAYFALFGQGEGGKVGTLQRTTLETMQRSLSDEIKGLRTEIRTLAEEHGTDDLTSYHAMLMQTLNDLERRISEVELQIAERPDRPARASATPEAEPAQAPDDAPAPQLDLTPEQIAAVDRQMEELLTRRRAYESTLETLKSQGFGAGHQSIKATTKELAAHNQVIQNYARDWNATRDSRPLPTNAGPETFEQLQARLSRLQALAARLRTTAVGVGKKKLTIEEKQREITEKLTQLDDVTQRLNALTVESKVEQAISRIEIIPPERAPGSPTVDPRKKYAAMGGGLAGAGVVGLAFLIGLLDRRFRYSDELNESVDGKLLACLPVMAKSTGEDEATAAVHSLHQVRAQMQIVSAERRTIAITSANAGDGKTSLCLSLGISFAGVGHRTLLIDLDIIGHGLSSRMRMCDGEGVLEALAAGAVEGHVRRSHVPGLDVLPVGGGIDASPARLRREEVMALLRNAAASYDTVLVDTGPLLGSLEANFVCSSADGVVLVVGRGQSRSLVKRTVAHIREINASLLGVVFNRARGEDFRSSSVSASFRSVRSTHSRPAPRGPASASANIDPLADAVFVDAQSYRDIHSDDPDRTAA